MINAAIVGLGWWGKTLVESLADGSDVMRFVAMTTRTVTPDVEAFAKEHKLRLLDSYEAVLGDRSIDAVVLATPPSGHVKQIIAFSAKSRSRTQERKPRPRWKPSPEPNVR
jgi:predicted dehydrogenase